ncbi:MAG: SMI1/KNR4 family protein [Ktedonobacteraceae bacterium]
MQSSHDFLFERIRQKCQRQGWYGGDLLSPTRRIVPQDDPQRTGFAFSPASEEQLAATEAALGFSLPPLLRALYAQVANGGFGSGTGIRGASDGYGTPLGSNEDKIDETIIGCFGRKYHRQQIDLADYEWQKPPVGSINTNDYLFLPYEVWPRHLLRICDMGCVEEVCIDPQERLFLAAASEYDGKYLLLRLAPSFEQWLEDWLNN